MKRKETKTQTKTSFTNLVQPDEHGGREGEGEEVGQGVPVPELHEHQDANSSTASARERSIR